MAMKVSKSQVGGWKKKALAAKKRMDKVSAQTSKQIETAVHTAEVSSAAFVAGVVQGRYGGIEVMGIPMDLGLAALLHVGGFMGVGGKMSSHLHGFADGFLASFLTTTGRGVGQSWKARVEAEKKPGAVTEGHHGELPGSPSGGSALTDDERRMAAAAAAL